MRDEHGLSAQETADRLGLTVAEVNRRYKAMKAYEQMVEDDQYGGQVTGGLFTLFEEVLKSPVSRGWLAWDPPTNRFANEENLEEFYQLIVPIEDDEGQTVEPRLKTYRDARELKRIVQNPEALAALLGPEGTLVRALAIVEEEKPPTNGWRKATEKAVEQLNQVGLEQIDSLSEEDLDLLRRLRTFADRMLHMRGQE